jgi:hypothetical protein
MKRTLLTILITAAVTSGCWYVVTEIRRGVEWLWLESSVVAPGRMALDALQADLNAGHTAAAGAKLGVLRQQWDALEDERGFNGQGVGNIMGAFSKLEGSFGKTTSSPTPDTGRVLSAQTVEGKHSVLSSAGFVPDEVTATRIAEAVWIPIYGRKQIEEERPFVATLSNGVWTVTGTLPEGYVGGTAVAEISKESGCILRISHGM